MSKIRECDCKEFQDSGHTDECNLHYNTQAQAQEQRSGVGDDTNTLIYSEKSQWIDTTPDPLLVKVREYVWHQNHCDFVTSFTRDCTCGYHDIMQLIDAKLGATTLSKGGSE